MEISTVAFRHIASTDEAVQQEYEKYYSQADRDQMDDADFAGPHKSFPIRSQIDVHNAARLIGHADNPDAVKAAIKRIAKRKGFSLPDAWKEDEQESFIPPQPVALLSDSRPKDRIASIQVCWIEDGAISLNRRIYPAETVDRLIASGQRKLSDPSALPLTCFLSHADADGDETRHLIGQVTRLWKEGIKGMASIDLADTSVSRDALALITGRYIRTESLRAKNAELRNDPRYDVPMVTGDSIELEGIDLTNFPGLEQVARIQQVQIAESVELKHPFVEAFENIAAVVEVQGNMDVKKDKIAEVAGGNMPSYTPATGNSVGMTSDPTQDAYSQRMYKAAPVSASGLMQGMQSVAPLMEAHDRVAMVQGRACAPTRESAEWETAYEQLEVQERELLEAGRKLSGKNDKHLDAVHDAIAKHLEMACEGVSNKKNDPDMDGDDDSTDDPQKNPDFALDKLNKSESAKHVEKKGTSPMSKEEALKLLEAQGYDVHIEKKKTETELLREQIASMQAEQSKQMEEMRALFTQHQQAALEAPNPTRRSLVNTATATPNARSIRKDLYHHGQYLREKLTEMDWVGLADRTCPLPDGLQLEQLIKEFEQLYAYQYDEIHNMLSATL